MPGWLAQLEKAGYAMLPAMFAPSEVAAALDSCSNTLKSAAAADSVLADSEGAAYGCANVLRVVAHRLVEMLAECSI